MNVNDKNGEFSATQRGAGDGPPGAVAAFPYDRLTVERFREAFPAARWRDDLRAWFVPGTQAERRLARWAGREWSGVLAFADARGRDAFAFDPITSPYLEAADDVLVRTPWSRAVIEELRAVPWAVWDPDAKAWRVPFRSWEELRRRWPAIEAAARLAEPEERRRRREDRGSARASEESRALAAERRLRRYPVLAEALPPLDRVLMTHAGCVMFEAVHGELVDPAIATRFYPGVASGTLVWSEWRRPKLSELIKAWPSKVMPGSEELARGWWQPTIELLRQERRKAAALERAVASRQARRTAS